MPKNTQTDPLARVMIIVTPVLSAAVLALIGTAIRFLVKSMPKPPEPAATPWRFEPGMAGYRVEMRSVAPVGPENPHAPPTPPFGVRRIGTAAQQASVQHPASHAR